MKDNLYQRMFPGKEKVSDIEYNAYSIVKMANIPESYFPEHSLIPTPKDEPAFMELQKIELDSANWIKNGNSLLIYSNNCGNGKTTWAIKIAMNYIKEKARLIDPGKAVYFINVNTLFFLKKESLTKPVDGLDKMEDRILKSDLVIFDDFPARNLTNYENEYLLYLINSRLEKCKSIIYTCNSTQNQLINNISGQLYDRIVNLSTNIIFTDTTRRKNNGK